MCCVDLVGCCYWICFDYRVFGWIVVCVVCCVLGVLVFFFVLRGCCYLWNFSCCVDVFLFVGVGLVVGVGVFVVEL